jgi:hypothetical protein
LAIALVKPTALLTFSNPTKRNQLIMATATVNIKSKRDEIKAYASTLDGFIADFDQRKKAEWLAAIQRYEAAKTAVTEAVEPIAANTVEPAALVVEEFAVQAHTAATSPKAINGYRTVLRGAIWIGVGLVLAIGLVYTLAMLAWDAIDGEPAIVYWAKSYAKTPRGQQLQRSVLEQYQTARAEVQLVGAPLVARAKEVRAIVQGGAAKVFGA